MPLLQRFRVIRTGTGSPSWSDRLLPAISSLSVVALVELVIRHGYRLRFPPAVDIALYCFEWLVVAAFALDVVLGFWTARSRSDYVRGHWMDLLLLVLVIAVMFTGVAATLLAIGRQAFVTFRAFARSRRWVQLVESMRRQPTQLLALSFLVLIAVGALLLTFPASTADGRGTPFLDALFTATSATCVTGLVVRDIEFYFSRFGQWIIITLIQLGGLGIMTFSASIMVLLGRKLGVGGRQTMGTVIEDSRDLDLARSLRYILLFTLLAEGSGTVVLFLRWLGDFAHPVDAFYHAMFHSVSAFCNAGFSTFSQNLVRYQGDVVVNFTVMGLIILGGLGFAVAHEILSRGTFRALIARLRRKGAAARLQLSTHAYLVLRTTAILLFLGAVLFLFFEFDNSLAGLPVGTKLLAAMFQSVTPRTAGFNTVPLDSLRPVTLFFVTVLMFIGASPGSTGGGIKTSTLAVLFLTFRNLVAGRDQVEVRGRTVSRDTVYRAAAIAAIASAALGLVLAVLLVSETATFQQLLFEAASAFGTVGLSTGITPGLSAVGKTAIIVLMYVGRVGPLTLAFVMRTRLSRVPVSYPDARVMVG